MASLIPCPACDRQVSNEAVACPNCGQPILGRTSEPLRQGPAQTGVLTLPPAELRNLVYSDLGELVDHFRLVLIEKLYELRMDGWDLADGSDPQSLDVLKQMDAGNIRVRRDGRIRVSYVVESVAIPLRRARP